MHAPRNTTSAGVPAEVPVWDPFVRVFHWSLVGLIALAFTTGDRIEGIHIATGCAIAALTALRVVWGFAGTHHARFTNFVRPPVVTLINLRDAMLLRAPRHIGHNPAGAAMILALIAMITATCTTGYLLTGPAWGSEPMEDLHGLLATATLILAGLHVLGVIAVSLETRENLVKSMFTGRKRAP